MDHYVNLVIEETDTTKIYIFCIYLVNLNDYFSSQPFSDNSKKNQRYQYINFIFYIKYKNINSNTVVI